MESKKHEVLLSNEQIFDKVINLTREYKGRTGSTWMYYRYKNRGYLLEYERQHDLSEIKENEVLVEEIFRGKQLLRNMNPLLSQTRNDNPLKQKLSLVILTEARETPHGNFYCYFSKRYFVVSKEKKLLKVCSQKEWKDKATLGKEAELKIPLKNVLSIF